MELGCATASLLLVRVLDNRRNMIRNIDNIWNANQIECIYMNRIYAIIWKNTPTTSIKSKKWQSGSSDPFFPVRYK